MGTIGKYRQDIRFDLNYNVPTSPDFVGYVLQDMLVRIRGWYDPDDYTRPDNNELYGILIDIENGEERITSDAKMTYKEILASQQEKDQKEKEAIIRAIGSIPGTKSEALLIRCYKEQKEFRFQVAMLLVKRGDTRYRVLNELAGKDRGVASLTLKLKTGAQDTLGLARELLKQGTIEQRVQTAYVVTVFHQYDMLDELWELANYRHSGYYPGDAYVRHAALRAILRLELSRVKDLSGKQWSGMEGSRS